MDLKALQDWVVYKHLMSVPDVAAVSIFGGETREYQVQVDPDKLVAYGISMAQVEQQLTANNVNGGGSFIEKGQQAYNIRAVGLMENTADIGATVLKVQNGTPVRVRDIAIVTEGPKIRLGKLGKAIRHDDGKVIDNDDVVEGIVQMRKGAEAEAVLHNIDLKVDFLNQHVLPPGVKIVPHIDRDDLVHLTTHTVLHNLTEGILLVVIVLFFFLGNIRSRADCRGHHSVLAVLRLHPAGPAAHSGEPAVAGRAGLRHDRGRCGGDGGKHSAAAGDPHRSWLHGRDHSLRRT